MVDVSFCLTRDWVANSALPLLAEPLNEPNEALPIFERAQHFIEAEVVARVIALATSFFAAIDCIAHLTSGVTKFSNSEEALHHLKQSAKFLLITLVGSVVATILPSLLKYCDTDPFPPSGSGGPSSWEETTATVHSLWDARTDVEQFRALWEPSPLHEKRTFVQLLDNDSTTEGHRAKRELLNVIYRRATDGNAGWWSSQKDTNTFFHATSLEGLEGILRSGKVEVRHEKLYRGAFVSTRPETGFGDYVLKFNRSIERLSPVGKGFSTASAYWSGFANDIPVTEKTVSEIVVYGQNSELILPVLQEKCREWAGREIQVIQGRMDSGLKNIPREWPGIEPDEGVARWAEPILETLRVRAAQGAARSAGLQQQLLVAAPLQMQQLAM